MIHFNFFFGRALISFWKEERRKKKKYQFNVPSYAPRAIKKCVRDEEGNKTKSTPCIISAGVVAVVVLTIWGKKRNQKRKQQHKPKILFSLYTRLTIPNEKHVRNKTEKLPSANEERWVEGGISFFNKDGNHHRNAHFHIHNKYSIPIGIRRRFFYFVQMFLMGFQLCFGQKCEIHCLELQSFIWHEANDHKMMREK